MSGFQNEFEKAVREVSAEIDAMDDAAFAEMLIQHRNGDIAQILREAGAYPSSFEETIPVFEGTFSADLARQIYPQSQLQVTQVIIPELTTNPAPPQACLIAA